MIFMNSRNTLVAAIIIFGGITLTIIITQTLISQLTDYIDWFQENRVEGSIVFLTLYLLFGLFALPASFHKYLAGVIFGFIPGVLIAWIGSMLGAIFPFIAGKKWANPYAQRTLERNPQLVGLQDYMIDNGKKTVALTQLFSHSVRRAKLFLWSYRYKIQRLHYRKFCNDYSSNNVCLVGISDRNNWRSFEVRREK